MQIKKILNAKTMSALAGIVVARDLLLDKAGLQRKQSAAASIGSSILLVGIGAAVGAGAALLLAPKTGPEIRGDLAMKAGQLKGKLTRKNGTNGSLSETPSYSTTISDDVSIG